MNGQASTGPIDFGAVLWPARGPGYAPCDLYSLRHTLRKLPGWPWPPDDRCAMPLVKAVADRFATSCEHARSDAIRAAHWLADDLGEYYDSSKESIIETWKRLTIPAFHASACRHFREKLDMLGDGSPSRALVPGLLLDCQPMVVGGPEKSMKTCLTIELAAAITTGSTFLGLAIPEPERVFVITAEKPSVLWRADFCRAVEARGGDRDAAMNRLDVSDSRDWLRKKAQRAELTSFLLMPGPKVVVFDPLYLFQPSVQTSDLVAMGKVLRYLVKPIAEGDAPPVFVHHFTKSVAPGTPPTLGDLSGAGVGAFVRSWVLVNRQTAYTGGKAHDLLALVGTSAGECSSCKIRFDEAARKVEVRSHGSEKRRNGSGSARVRSFLAPRE